MQSPLNNDWLKSFSVPVYDGWATKHCPAFTFSDNDFRHLLTWPLYKKGQVKILGSVVVSVGYSIGTYNGKGSFNLSTNVQFVIVLAIPEAI